VLIIILNINHAGAASRYHFALFIPDDTPFWSRVALFAKSAALDLDIKLTVFDADANRILMLQQFKEAQRVKHEFDALIFPNFLKTAPIALAGCKLAKIPCILYNSDLSDDDKSELGFPGERNKYWIAQLIPDDEGSAYAIAEKLFEKAHEVVDNPISMVAVNGFNADAPAIKRELGLRKALDKDLSITLRQVFYTDWSEDDAYRRTKGFLTRYPKTEVIWSANYRTTNGILRALYGTNRLPGRDVLINSYDIDPVSLDNISNGTVAVAAGGHYVEGAWAVVMGFDYLKGYRLKEQNKIVHTPLLVVTQDNLQEVKTALVQLEREPETLGLADFATYSMIKNPNQPHYNFSLGKVLAEILHR